jgi:hypothetical protein
MGVQVRYKALRQGFHNSQDNPLTPFAKGKLFRCFRALASSQKLGDHLSLHVRQAEVSAHVAIG